MSAPAFFLRRFTPIHHLSYVTRASQATNRNFVTNRGEVNVSQCKLNTDHHKTVYVTKRSFGIADTISNFATSKVEGSKEKHFESMVKSMLEFPNWTLRPWKQTMEGQLSSWFMYIPGMSGTKEVQQIKKFKSMLDCIPDKELDNPELIDGVSKARIALKAEVPVEDVNKLLHYYRQSYVVQQWLIMKKSAGERIPANETELQSMQDTDVRVRSIAKRVMAGGGARQRKGGRGRGTPF